MPDDFKSSRFLIQLSPGHERYFQHEFEDELKIYEKRQEIRRAGKELAKDSGSPKESKLLIFEIKDGAEGGT